MRYIQLILLLILFPLGSFSYSQPASTTEIHIDKNPGNLRGYVFAPSPKRDSLKSRPLVVALHGCSQNHGGFAKTTDWNKLAQLHDIVILYPSQKRSNNPNNCFNWFRIKDISKNSGEVQSIINMIAQTVQAFSIDTSQIYMYGVSAGAAMGLSLLALYPSQFRSGAIFAGAPYKTAENSWEATKAMLTPVDRTPEEWGQLVTRDPSQQEFPKLLVFHGVKDKVVDIQYAYELIEQWSWLHQMDAVPDSILTNFPSQTIDRLSYQNAKGYEKIVFYRMANLGHAIPVDPGDGKVQGGTSGWFAKDTDFFSTYRVAQEFGLIEKKTISGKE